MNVIIVGCGNVGCTLVENLRNEKHNIVIVDKEEEKIREVNAQLKEVFEKNTAGS